MPRTNRATLAAELAHQNGCSKAKAKELIAAVFQAAQIQLQAGNAVYIRNFGRFEVADSAARIGRNPSTGEEIEIKARKRVKFRSSANLLGETL